MEHFIQLYKLLRRLCKRSFVQVDKIPCARFAFLLRPSRHHTAAHRIVAADQFHRSKKKASYRTAAADRDSRPELHALQAFDNFCFPDFRKTAVDDLVAVGVRADRRCRTVYEWIEAVLQHEVLVKARLNLCMGNSSVIHKFPDIRMTRRIEKVMAGKA